VVGNLEIQLVRIPYLLPTHTVRFRLLVVELAVEPVVGLIWELPSIYVALLLTTRFRKSIILVLQQLGIAVEQVDKWIGGELEKESVSEVRERAVAEVEKEAVAEAVLDSVQEIENDAVGKAGWAAELQAE
jgi:hypothetical protein